MERKAQRGQESWLRHTDGRWQSQDSLHKPLPVSYNQVSNVALESMLRETSQTRNAPCTGPAIPPYQTISRPPPFGRRARCAAQDSAMLTSPGLQFLEINHQGPAQFPPKADDSETLLRIQSPQKSLAVVREIQPQPRFVSSSTMTPTCRLCFPETGLVGRRAIG